MHKQDTHYNNIYYHNFKKPILEAKKTSFLQASRSHFFRLQEAASWNPGSQFGKPGFEPRSGFPNWLLKNELLGVSGLGPRELAPTPRGVWNPQPPQTTCRQSQARWSPGDTGRRCAALGTHSGAYAAPLPWGLLLGLDELGRVLFHPDRPDWPVSCRPPAAPHGRGGARWPTLRWSCGLRWAHPSSFGWGARSLRLVHPPHGKFAPEPARAARRGTARLQPARKRRDGRPGRLFKGRKFFFFGRNHSMNLAHIFQGKLTYRRVTFYRLPNFPNNRPLLQVKLPTPEKWRVGDDSVYFQAWTLRF